MSTVQISELNKNPEVKDKSKDIDKLKDANGVPNDKKDQPLESNKDSSKIPNNPEIKDAPDGDEKAQGGEDSEKKKPGNGVGFPLKIIIFIIIALGLIFAILQLAYYIYECIIISNEDQDLKSISVDILLYTEIRNRTGYDVESTRSYLLAFSITEVVVSSIYLIVHCVLILGAIKENLWICLAWCITVTVCIVIRIIVILCVPLVMFTYMGIEIVFEIIWLGFVIFFIIQIKKNQKPDPAKEKDSKKPTSKSPKDEAPKVDKDKLKQTKPPKTMKNVKPKNNKITPATNPKDSPKKDLKELSKVKDPSESQPIPKQVTNNTDIQDVSSANPVK